MIHTHNHEQPAMASKFFPDMAEASRSQRARAKEAPRPRPLDENAAGAHPSGPPPPGLPAGLAPGARCKVKGCIYPATQAEAGMCLCHFHQEEEPRFFQSRQPSLRMLEIARYGLTTEDEDNRLRRKRQAMELRQAFLKGMA
ncbi:MAG TPA: hypothetical protein VG028_14415 [Terriglobia bacterium]|nr:hypothetical protein [Terriglobia bacterium]